MFSTIIWIVINRWGRSFWSSLVLRKSLGAEIWPLKQIRTFQDNPRHSTCFQVLYLFFKCESGTTWLFWCELIYEINSLTTKKTPNLQKFVKNQRGCYRSWTAIFPIFWPNSCDFWDIIIKIGEHRFFNICYRTALTLFLKIFWKAPNRQIRGCCVEVGRPRLMPFWCSVFGFLWN